MYKNQDQTILKGIVVKVLENGAFVDIGEKKLAFLPLAQMPKNNFQSVNDLISVNQQIEVMIFNTYENEITLTMFNRKYSSIFDEIFDYQVNTVENIILNCKDSKKNQIVFFGDSLFEFFDVKKYLPQFHIYNNALAGATTELLLYLQSYSVKRYDPKAVFVLIGTNDLCDLKKVPQYESLLNIRCLLDMFKKQKIKNIYILSVLPINENIQSDKNKSNAKLIDFKSKVENIVLEYGGAFEFIDIYDKMLDNKNQLREEFTTDGLHLSEEGYIELSRNLKPYLSKLN